jgi:hypothetical protein
MLVLAFGFVLIGQGIVALSPGSCGRGSSPHEIGPADSPVRPFGLHHERTLRNLWGPDGRLGASG